MKKNILILGVSGFLGYHLAKKCLKKLDGKSMEFVKIDLKILGT